MKWALFPLILALSTTCATLGTFSPESALPSIQRLVADGNPICTTFPINEGVWVTAAHCLRNGDEFKIGEAVVSIIKLFPDQDVAILSGPPAPPLSLGREAPRVGDAVYTFGQVGQTPFLIYFGRVSRLAIPTLSMWDLSLIIQGGGGSGTSGAPILNKRGEVISIVRGGSTNAAVTVMTIGLPFDHLWDTLGPYIPTPNVEGLGWFPDWFPFGSGRDPRSPGDAEVGRCGSCAGSP